MRVDDLRNFVAVADAGSLARAAAGLGASQPALSKSLARLERALRVTLVERHARGVRLTAAGATLLLHARHVDVDIRDALAALRDLRHGESGNVRIGVGVGIPQALMAAACQPLLASGRISIEIQGGMSDSLFQAVLTGQADFALTGVRPPEGARLAWTPLFRDPMIAVAHRTHALAAASKVSWSMLAEQAWIVPNVGTITRDWFEQQFRERALAPPSRIVSLRGYPTFYELAADGSALLLVSLALARGGRESGFVEIKRPPDWRSERVVGLLAREGGYASAAAMRAMKAVTAAARRMFRGAAL